MTDLDRERLIKILGMTGSEHDGEALAALHKAQRMMADAKVTWAELLKQVAAQSQWAPPPPRRQPWQEEAWRREENRRAQERAEQDRRRFEEELARQEKAAARERKLRAACATILTKYRWLLTEWEAGFLEDWANKPEDAWMSEKQLSIFERIVAKYNAKRRAAA